MCIFNRADRLFDNVFKKIPFRLTSLKKSNRGFTLLELVTVLMIFCIICLFAFPIIINSLIKSEADYTQRLIENTINLAKVTSFTNHQRVFMCLLNEEEVCDKNADEYLLLFFDKNQNNKFDRGTDRVISKEALNLKYARVSMRVSLGRHYSRFSKDWGTPRGHYGHFKYCPIHPLNDAKYQVSFNQTGNIRLKPDSIKPTGC